MAVLVVLVSDCLIATSAGVVARVSVGKVVAVEKLLLGELEKFTACNEVGTFKRADCGESPARSAVSLVFNVGDGASLDPVD